MIGAARLTRMLTVALAFAACVVVGSSVASAAVAPVAAAPVSAPGTTTATPADLAARLAAAQESYDRGIALRNEDPEAARAAFEEAAHDFEQLIDLVGANGPLWFNLGNARIQAGQLGEGILALRNAERFMPSDGRLQANLGYARSLRSATIEARGADSIWGPLLSARHILSPEVRAGLALGLNLLVWILVALRLLGRAVPLLALAAAALLAVAAAATTVADVVEGRRFDEGVLVRNDVVLRKGNGEGYEAAVTERLSEGLELRVLEERPGWSRVRLADGTEGWVRGGEVGVVRGGRGESGE